MKLHNINTNILIQIYEHNNSKEFRTGFVIVPSANFKALCLELWHVVVPSALVQKCEEFLPYIF